MWPTKEGNRGDTVEKVKISSKFRVILFPILFHLVFYPPLTIHSFVRSQHLKFNGAGKPFFSQFLILFTVISDGNVISSQKFSPKQGSWWASFFFWYFLIYPFPILLPHAPSPFILPFFTVRISRELHVNRLHTTRAFSTYRKWQNFFFF